MKTTPWSEIRRPGRVEMLEEIARGVATDLALNEACVKDNDPELIRDLQWVSGKAWERAKALVAELGIEPYPPDHRFPEAR